MDVVEDIRLADVDRLIAAFTPEHHLDRDATLQAVRTGGSVNAVHIRTAVKVAVADSLNAVYRGLSILEQSQRFSPMPIEG